MEHTFWLLDISLSTEAIAMMGLLLGACVTAIGWQAKENKRLHGETRQDAKDSMAIIGSFDKMLDKLISQQGAGEQRITQAVRDSAKEVKEHVDTLKTHLESRNAKT